MTVDRDHWLAEVESVRAWKRGEERAPHKPLLLLFLLGRIQRTGTSIVAFADAEQPLAQLLKEFGPPRDSSMAYPFHYLQSDGFWTVETQDGSPTRASAGALRSAGAVGHLDHEFETALRDDPALLAVIGQALLDANWEPSLHYDILDTAGLDLVGAEVAAVRARSDEFVHERRTRDRAFRERVLTAYEYRCAFCLFDGRLGSQSVGLDAAHVRWWAYDGPDLLENGLCLCTMHHKLFDLGALGVSRHRTVLVSRHFIGRGRTAEDLVLGLHGHDVAEPQRGEPGVHDEHIEWHGREVFREPARE